MKTNPFIHHRSNTAPPRDERRPHAVNDVHALTKKALERWENEGGRIPDVVTGNDRSDFARTERF